MLTVGTKAPNFTLPDRLKVRDFLKFADKVILYGLEFLWGDKNEDQE